jgi:programmed cell death 8 (apoptosis-inducing factor)
LTLLNFKSNYLSRYKRSDLGPKIGFEAIGLVDSSLNTVGLFAKADQNDTPQAAANQTNENLRSEVSDTKIPEAGDNQLKTPSSNDEFGKGVVLYLRNNTVVGVLLWNVFKRIPIARQVNLFNIKNGLRF